MLFLIVLAFLAYSNLVSHVAAADKSTRIQSHDKEITKRSDGLMHELVNLLADEKFHRKTNEMIDRMVKQNEKILKEFAGFSTKLKGFEKKLTTEMKMIKKKLGVGEIEQEKTNKIIKQIQKNIRDLKNGAVYIRWGRTRCPFRDTKLVYSGYAAGGHYSKHSGTNTQCLPKNPNWRKYNDGANTVAHIYGAEYEIYHSVGEALHNSYRNYDVPCAVCQSKKRHNVHMIPARDRCNKGWHLEYRGYLMSQRDGYGASTYICMDANPEKKGSIANHDGRLFSPVESACGSLPCPPYVNNRELTCAVCTF